MGHQGACVDTLRTQSVLAYSWKKNDGLLLQVRLDKTPDDIQLVGQFHDSEVLVKAFRRANLASS